jgi:hypothetical protein
MLRVPLQPVANQTLAVTLARQPTQIALRQNGSSIYIDVSVNRSSVIRGRICRDRQRLLLDAHYRGFAGELAFVDLQGKDDPQWQGLGSRWQLYYIEAGA